MPFRQNINFIQNLCTNAQNQQMYGNSFHPLPSQLPSLVLLYPGRIPNKGDYRLEFNSAALSHTDIVEAVYNCALAGNGQTITNFLVDLFNNGLNADSNQNVTITIQGFNLTLDEFKYLTYWLILQEDINYPRPRYMGVRMPIIRYIEGAVAAIHNELLPLDEVKDRTNNHGGPPPRAFNHPNLTGYLAHNLNQI